MNVPFLETPLLFCGAKPESTPASDHWSIGEDDAGVRWKVLWRREIRANFRKP